VPFTISHAAAVLPLRKISNARLPLAALMIGSMSPDFAVFLPGEPLRTFTHTFAGLFAFCWPVSVAVWLLFVRVLEEPTLALLPDSWHAKFVPSDRGMSLAALALVSAAVLIGGTTHIIWDAFTHRGTAVVQALPALHSVAFHYNGWRIRWFVVLQHLSSVIGMLVLMIWAWKLPPIHESPRSLPPVSHATRLWAVAILIAVSVGLAITSYALNSDRWFMRRLFHFAIGGMAGWVLAWIAIAVVIMRRARRPMSTVSGGLDRR
jgi:hypothetical protein